MTNYTKTIRPYGYIRNDLVKAVWEYKGNYFIKDRVNNICQIDEETYKEIQNDTSRIYLHQKG